MVVMDFHLLKSTFLSLVLTLVITLATAAFNDHSEKILLSDVKALTLHHGQMTSSRRSPPVPQVKCVGGVAHYKFTPKVVQCINKGSDGHDIQWECKTDMDNAFRFGKVAVTCEGYDYPNDPFVLKGSCGLEYTLEFTEEGLKRENQKGGYNYHNSYNYNGSTGGIGGFIVFVGVLFLMYVIFKMCIAPTDHTAPRYGTEQPPPYGFRSEFMPRQGPPPPSYDNCGSSQGYTNTGFTSPNTGFTSPNTGFTSPNTGFTSPNTGFTSAPTDAGSGFWTGAATGGLLGYLFGRGNNYNYGPTYRPRSSWFGQDYSHSNGPSASSGSFFSSSAGGGPSSSSSGTRTASGYGGTSRR